MEIMIPKSFSKASSNPWDSSRSVVASSSTANTSIMQMPSVRNDEQEWKKGLPPGVMFLPSMEDYIYLLEHKVHTGDIPMHGVIKEIDLYKYEPEELEGLAYESHEGGHFYFFTKLKNKYSKGTRVERTTLRGFWKGTQRTTKIKSCNENNEPVTIAKTPLCYHLHHGKHAKKTQWLMDEYRLLDGNNYQHTKEKNWALCVMHLKKKQEMEIGNNNVEEEEEDEEDEEEEEDYKTDMPAPSSNPLGFAPDTLDQNNSSGDQNNVNDPTFSDIYTNLPDLVSDEYLFNL